MEEKTFTLGKMQGLGAAVVVAVFVMIRIVTLGESDDEGLHAIIKAKLLMDSGSRISQTLSKIDVTDEDEVDRIIEMADEESIELHSVKVSAPLLSFESNQRVIVYVEYTLPDDPPRAEYWRFKQRLLGRWQYAGPSSSFSYYLNFF